MIWGIFCRCSLCTLDPVFHPDWNPWIAELAEVFACIFLCFSMVMCIKNFMETHDVTESCLVVIEGKWIRNVLFHRFQWWFKDIQGIYSRILSLKLIPHYVKRENLGTLGRAPFCPLYIYNHYITHIVGIYLGHSPKMYLFFPFDYPIWWHVTVIFFWNIFTFSEEGWCF